jgi:hypothetical protein
MRLDDESAVVDDPSVPSVGSGRRSTSERSAGVAVSMPARSKSASTAWLKVADGDS